MEHVGYELNDNTIVIYGSNDYKDILTSINFLPKQGFHRGCLKAANYIYRKIKPELEIAETIRLLGHSFGGSVAQVLAYKLQKEGYTVECRVHGAYPVTTKYIHIKGYSMISGNDPVPSLFPFYKHVSNKIYIGSDRKWYKICFKDHMRYE